MHTWTTLKELREAGACKDRYNHLVNALGNNYGDDTPIDLLTILRCNGLDDVLWIPRRIVHGDHIDMRYRLLAVACAQDVLHLLDDPRSRNAVRVAHLYAYDEATDEELLAAREVAWEVAWPAAQEAAAAWVVAFEVARTSAREAAREAATAREAAWNATWDAAEARQAEWFRVIFGADEG